MSRNLGRLSCYFCEGEVRVDDPIVEKSSCLVNATCVDCEAKYAAWTDGEIRTSQRFAGDGRITDLSFRSTINDEPGAEDLPRWRIGRVRVGPWEPR